jgi:hypothetical protein
MTFEAGLIIGALVVAGGGLLIWGLSSRSIPLSAPGADHDLNDLKAGPSATAWRHTDRCPHCLSEIGHQEIMTDICLSCGRNWEYISDVHHAAIRNVVWNGRWVADLLIDKKHYSFDGKNWGLFPARTPSERANWTANRPSLQAPD